MKKFTKISLIIAAVMAGVGIVLLGIASMMGAGYHTLRQMAGDGEFYLGNWHLWESGIYYDDSDGENQTSSDFTDEFAAAEVEQLQLEVELAEIVFTQSEENDIIAVELYNAGVYD